MVKAARGAAAAEPEQVLMVAVSVRTEGGCEVGTDLREAEPHVGRAGGAVEVAGGEAWGRQSGALLREGVAESPVGDEAIPPAWMDACNHVCKCMHVIDKSVTVGSRGNTCLHGWSSRDVQFRNQMEVCT